MVTMMRVGKMSVGMDQGLVSMRVSMLVFWRDGEIVKVLMMFVVAMVMSMFHDFVRVLMCVVFRQVQPETDTHQYSGHQEPEGEQLSTG
jgi:hypothetical protein